MFKLAALTQACTHNSSMSFPTDAQALAQAQGGSSAATAFASAVASSSTIQGCLGSGGSSSASANAQASSQSSSGSTATASAQVLWQPLPEPFWASSRFCPSPGACRSHEGCDAGLFVHACRRLQWHPA